MAAPAVIAAIVSGVGSIVEGASKLPCALDANCRNTNLAFNPRGINTEYQPPSESIVGGLNNSFVFIVFAFLMIGVLGLLGFAYLFNDTPSESK